MTQSFIPIITNFGLNLILQSISNGTDIDLKYMAWGDGGGSLTSPTPTQTQLVNETFRQPITTVSINSTNPNWLEILTVVPPSIGGFYIREVGIFTSDNHLFAVASHPEIYKSDLEAGSVVEFREKIILEITNLQEVNITLQVGEVNAHNEDPNAHAGIWVRLTGDTMTGNLSIPNGTLPNHAVNLSQIQNKWVRLTGDTMTGNLSIPNGTLPNHAVNLSQLPVITDSTPIGVLFPWTSLIIPDGYLECNGQAISRTTFSELFGKISTTYGVGNGSTTFNLPDLRGEFIRGWDHGRGIDAGRAFASSQSDELKSHTHTVAVPTNPTGTSTLVSDNGGANTTINSGSTGGSETRPRNLALMYIIKVKNIAGSDPSVEGANADTLDGLHASAFSLTTHTHIYPEHNILPPENVSVNVIYYAERDGLLKADFKSQAGWNGSHSLYVYVDYSNNPTTLSAHLYTYTNGGGEGQGHDYDVATIPILKGQYYKYTIGTNGGVLNHSAKFYEFNF